MAKEESFDIHSLTFILLFIIAMVFLSPLFGQVNISGKLVAPPPPPPVPSMSMGASSGTALDELPAEPSAPGALVDDSLPDEPAAPLAISANSLPAEPSKPGSPRAGSAATAGTPGTAGTTGGTYAAPASGSTSSSSSGGGGGGSAGSSGQRGSSESSIRGKAHLPTSSAPGTTGSSGSASSGTASRPVSAPVQPGRASSLQPIPVKTGPALDTGVVEPVETPLSYPTPLLSSPVVWYAGGGVLGAGFIITGILLYLKNKRRKNLLSTLSQPGLGVEPFSEQSLLPGSSAAIPPLDFSDMETKEIYDYLHDNATKGYVLDDLKDALAKNGFSQEKIKQVAESLQ